MRGSVIIQKHAIAMEFIVRYWVATAPVPFDGHKWDDSAWISHSTHPATRLGLRNAILSAEDRLAILYRQDEMTPHGCDIFLMEGEKIVIFSVHEADELLGMLERGEFSWESLEEMLASQVGPDEASNQNNPFPEYVPSTRKSDGVMASDVLTQSSRHPGVAGYFSGNEVPVVHQLDVDV